MDRVAAMVTLAIAAAGCGRVGYGLQDRDAGGADDAGPDAATRADAGPTMDAAPTTDGGPPSCGPFVLEAEPVLVDVYHPFLARSGATLWYSDNAALLWAPLLGDGSIGTGTRIAELDSVAPDIMPSVSADALEIAFARRITGSLHLFRASRDADGSPFATASEIPFAGGASWDPELSPDATTLYFASNRDSDGDIFVTTRADRTTAFGAAVPLANVNSASLDGAPSVTADELTLVFASARGGGGTDLYITTRDRRTDDFSAPELLAELSSPGNDDDPTLSADGTTLLFASDRSGAFVVYRATRVCD